MLPPRHRRIDRAAAHLHAAAGADVRGPSDGRRGRDARGAARRRPGCVHRRRRRRTRTDPGRTPRRRAGAHLAHHAAGGVRRAGRPCRSRARPRSRRRRRGRRHAALRQRRQPVLVRPAARCRCGRPRCVRCGHDAGRSVPRRDRRVRVHACARAPGRAARRLRAHVRAVVRDPRGPGDRRRDRSPRRVPDAREHAPVRRGRPSRQRARGAHGAPQHPARADHAPGHRGGDHRGRRYRGPGAARRASRSRGIRDRSRVPSRRAARSRAPRTRRATRPSGAA